jgi:hypothetical protein
MWALQGRTWGDLSGNLERQYYERSESDWDSTDVVARRNTYLAVKGNKIELINCETEIGMPEGAEEGKLVGMPVGRLGAAVL